MRLPYAPWLLGAALLVGCHRDSESAGYDLTGTYYAATTVQATNPIAMYVQAGRVSDQAVVTRFLARRPPLASYFSATDQSFTGYTVSLAFRANNRATLKSASSTYVDSIRTEVTNRQATSFQLQSLDSTSFAQAPANVPCNRPGELAGYLRGTTPGQRCVLVPTLGNLSAQACKTRPVRVVGARGSQLYIPYYSWLVQAGGCSLAFGGEWNTFNPAVLSHLAAGDTLVVQEREIALHR